MEGVNTPSRRGLATCLIRDASGADFDAVVDVVALWPEPVGLLRLGLYPALFGLRDRYSFSAFAEEYKDQSYGEL